MKLNDKIDNYLVDALDIDLSIDYNVVDVDSKTLLNSKRIDLIPKILYVESIDKKYNTNYFKELYLKNIEAFSEGSYKEPGKNKKGQKTFLNTFNDLICDIKKYGVDKNKTIVPIGLDNTIIDGAHRTAISIYYNLTLPVVFFDKKNINYDYYFFRKRFYEEKYLNNIIIEYAKRKNNLFCICLWPRNNDVQKKQAVEIIRKKHNIIMKKDVKLSFNGLKNFMIEIYGNQSWVGSIKNKHHGVNDKVNKCYNKDNSLTLIIVEAENVKDVLQTKKYIRDKMKIGNHSIHSTDNISETIYMLKLLLNDNSIKFLNSADIDKYPKVYKDLNRLSKKLDDNNIDHDEIAIDGSSVLAVYGLRENHDLDCILNSSIVIEDIDNHNNLLNYYEKTEDDIIFNPEFYFYFHGFKFVDIDLIKKMKSKRLEKKDADDIKLINSLFDNKLSLKKHFIRLKFNIKKITRNLFSPLKKVIIYFLKKFNLFNFVKKIRDFCFWRLKK